MNTTSQEEGGGENPSPVPTPTPIPVPTPTPIPVPTPTPMPVPTPTPTPTPTPSEKAKLELSDESFNIEVGGTANVEVNLNGDVVTDKATFDVNEPTVATVEGGLITALAPGTATVTVHVDGAEDAIFTITVTDPTLPSLVLNKESFEISLGETDNSLIVTLADVDVTNAQEVTYTVGDESVATVVGGVITASSVTYSEQMTTTVTVHHEQANDAIFSVTVNTDFSSIQNNKNIDNNSLTELNAIGQVSSSTKTDLTEIKIPAVYKNASNQLCKITGIEWGYFANCTNLTSVTIPGTVASIDSAFKNCTGLTSVTLMDGIKTIGSDAFFECKSLTSIEFPSSVTSIGSNAFKNCCKLENDKVVGLTSVTFKDNGPNLTSIGSEAFCECKSLTSIDIPDSVTSIDYHAFYNCESLETATLPDNTSFTRINEIFAGCKKLSTITIPANVTAIGYHAFCDCTALNVTVPNGVTEVGWEAFLNAYNVNYSGTLGGAPWGAVRKNGEIV